MNALRWANAIVQFRMLRSIGHFKECRRQGIYAFMPCTCGRLKIEPLPNGVPEPVKKLTAKEIVEDYALELGVLCKEHFG